MVTPTQQQKQPAASTATTVAGATKVSAEDEALKRNTDCVYFLASPLTCKKGSECEYRHSEYARVNPRDCYYWLNGNCMNPKCTFRHPPLDGLLGTQVAAPAGSSSQVAAAATTPASQTPYNQGASYSSITSKQAVPCFFHQKGLCLKGDKCAFLHGPATNNKAPQPGTTTTAIEPHSSKKAFGTLETSQLQKFPPTNVAKMVGVPPESKPAPKVDAAFARSGTGSERSMPRYAGLDDELPRHSGINTTSVCNGGSVGRSSRLHQSHASDEPSFHGSKDTDEFLRESSPGFDVLVDDDEIEDADFYHGEDQYGVARGHEGRNVNEYDIGHSATYDATTDLDRERFHDARGYDSFDHVQGNYGWEQRASSERLSLGRTTLERRGYSRADSPDHIEGSDLRHRLSKHRKVNGLRSVVSHDHALQNHEGERNYRGSSLRDSHNPLHENSLGSRLQGRIKLPGRSGVNGTDLRSEREIERGHNRGRLSPGRPQTSSHRGRLHDRIKGRLEGEFDNKGRNLGGSRIRREVMNEMNADFAGPKRLAELKVGKDTDNKERQSLGKRKIIEYDQQTEGDLSFEGPMPLSEILKRKKKSEAAASGSGIATVHKEYVNEKESKGSLISSSTNTVVSAALKEANRKEESKSTNADTGTTDAARGESSQPRNISEHEADNGIIANEGMEDHELEADDQGDADEYYEGEEGEYNYEEGENVDPEEEYMEEEDGDDFAKKLGVMFS